MFTFIIVAYIVGSMLGNIGRWGGGSDDGNGYF